MHDDDMTPLRQAGLDAAREELHVCLTEEVRAEAVVQKAERAFWHRQDEAMALSDDDDAVETYAAWLPQGRRDMLAAQARLDRANTETVRARAVLAHARQAVTAPER